VTTSEAAIVGLVVILMVAIGALLVGGWAAFTCEHPVFARRRTWWKHHRYVVTCSLCQRIVARGRDLGHRYPDGAPGVQRGTRAHQVRRRVSS
jgi:hypothetical protein